MSDCAWCGKNIMLGEEDKACVSSPVHLKCSDEVDRRKNERICTICNIKMVEYSVFGMHSECVNQLPKGYPPA